MTSSDLIQMLNFGRFVVDSIFDTVSKYNLLWIPFIGFAVGVTIWILMHFITSDIFGWHGKMGRDEEGPINLFIPPRKRISGGTGIMKR